MDPGRLNQLVEIQKKASGRDGAGQPLTTWVPHASGVWANIKHQSGSQAIQSDAQTSVLKASIRLRWRTDVTPAMRVLHGATVYEILSVVPDLATRRWVDLVCQEVVNA